MTLTPDLVLRTVQQVSVARCRRPDPDTVQEPQLEEPTWDGSAPGLAQTHW